jgi:hypothetical protein
MNPVNPSADRRRLDDGVVRAFALGCDAPAQGGGASEVASFALSPAEWASYSDLKARRREMEKAYQRQGEELGVELGLLKSRASLLGVDLD